ncbi:MAG: universal stress protein, partial [Bacteroidia bacterium]
MGMRGAGPLAEKMIGSVTTSLIKKTKCPVLTIGEDVKFKSPKNIVFAFDNTEIKNEKALSPLKEFAALFKAHVYILNVIQPQSKTVLAVDNAAEIAKITHLLDGIENSFHHIHNENIIEGISDFSEKKNIDMVVMIPHAHSALHNLFNQPQTKRMAFHTKIPLLALHE